MIQLRTRARALKGFAKQYDILFDREYFDPTIFFSHLLRPLAQTIRDEVGQRSGVKFQIRVHILFHKRSDPAAKFDPHFNNKQLIVLPGSDIDQQIQAAYSDLNEKIEHFQRLASEWIIDKVLDSAVLFAKYQPIGASGFLPLPDWLSAKKAIINVQNDDDLCFCWSVLAGLHPAKHNPQRVSHYKQHLKTLKLDGIAFPVTLDQICTFEKLNALTISVFGIDDDKVVPLRLPEEHRGLNRHLNLLHVTQGTTSHYCLIKDLDKLLFQENNHKNKKYYCPRCLRRFYSEFQLNCHANLPCAADGQCLQMPEDDILCFRNYHKMIRTPLVCYADFECMLVAENTCNPNPSTSYTQIVQHHEPCGYSLVNVFQCCCHKKPDVAQAHVYRGEDAVDSFLAQILDTAERYASSLNRLRNQLEMTALDETLFLLEDECFACGQQFGEGESPVRDHCHFCGEYRGAAHSRCNMAMCVPHEIVVVMHNLRRYDSHLIMQRIGVLAHEQGIDITCIPKTMEDYISFTLQLKSLGLRIRFIDSFHFLPTSLQSLVDNLAKSGPEAFPVLKTHFPCAAQQKLLLRKGVYPYDFVTGMEKFRQDHLPCQADFYNKLTQKHISDEEYNHAKSVWTAFDMQTFGQYHDLYVLTDTLLLADVFERFRQFGLRHFRLDPCNYVTLPGLGFDACLLKSGVQIQLLTDYEMYSFFERGLRGGVAMISRRHAKANNPLLEDYNPNEPTSYIITVDANNLYGWCMLQMLPVRDFEWVENPDEIDVASIDDNASTGYVLEVDLDYPANLHERDNDFPLAPEKVKVTKAMLSSFCRNLRIDKETCGDSEKLVPNLWPKHNYVVHYRNLKKYIELGMVVKKIHRAVSFTQEAWIRDYVTMNTILRAAAESDFEKDLYKLSNNVIYGKTIENVRDRIDVKLVTNAKTFRKLIARPNFVRMDIFAENLVAVQMKRHTVWLNKPIFDGFAILDLSKLKMYNFHYDVIIKTYSSKNARMLFTDTDSFCYWIHTNCIYADMALFSEHLDTHDFPANHPLHNQSNKKVMGKFKDETHGVPVAEFVGLRSKMYSLLCADTSLSKKRAKGVSKAVIANELCHQDYLTTLQLQQVHRHTMYRIHSTKHQVYTVKSNKISLSSYDDKRFILSDGISSLAYGHHLLTAASASSSTDTHVAD